MSWPMIMWLVAHGGVVALSLFLGGLLLYGVLIEWWRKWGCPPMKYALLVTGLVFVALGMYFGSIWFDEYARLSELCGG